MENLWTKSHQFILDCKEGDFYMEGEKKISVVRRSPKRIYFSNGELVTIKESGDGGFFYLGGRNVNQVLRDIEGFFVMLKHDYCEYSGLRSVESYHK
jgi:hypothetical protein